MMMPGQSSDEELLRRMLDGDAEAFATLYDRRQGAVYRFALRMSGSPAFSEDITQEVFLALMLDANGFDPARGSVAAYLFGMTRHRVLRRIERERALHPLSSDEGGNEGAQLADTLPALDDPHLDF
jgi:RNA polymerase sigma-70 factor (ECF subfamily)